MSVSDHIAALEALIKYLKKENKLFLAGYKRAIADLDQCGYCSAE